MPETLVFTARDSGTAQAPVVWQAAGDGEVVISGGIELELNWMPFKDGIFQSRVPEGLDIDQLFVNGERQAMARYPNFDSDAKVFNGVAADCVSPARAKRWHDPRGGFMHAMHAGHWGGFSYRITGKDENGNITMDGGWQGNRASEPHSHDRYVENIFEELDAPGEWFFQRDTCTLYFHPPADLDLEKAIFEAALLRNLLQFTGTEKAPVRFITFRGMTFRHTARTFMETREPLLRSDWTICRAAAVLFEGTEDCTLEDSLLDQVGGNAVFASNYNRRITVRGCHIDKAGANGVMFVGDPDAVRNPLFEYGQRQNVSQLDITPGPKSGNYPSDCLVEDCLITMIGRVEKQATGVGINMAARIKVRHCSIYDVPRSGINIGDGCWGGHTVEFCDVFNTVLETGDHGSFNSWGRDRFWMLGDAPDEELPALALLDAVEPTVLRDSRWRCDHGWDIDLDDGSSNYQIVNNLCLNGGLKNREGFHRTVENNIIVNNGFHPHVWYANSGDVFRRNIVFSAHQPAIMPVSKWGKEIDYNLFASSEGDRVKFSAQGCDTHSLVGNPMFVGPENQDFRVHDGSPALKLGFRNFTMDRFGVQKPSLKAIAKTPEMPHLVVHASTSVAVTKLPRIWQGAIVRTLEGNEYSAFGVSRESGGILLESIPDGSLLDRQQLRAGDLVQAVSAQQVHDVEELHGSMKDAGGEPVAIRVVRGQKSFETKMKDYVVLAVKSAAEVEMEDVGGIVTGVDVDASENTANEPLHTLWDGEYAANYGPVFNNGVTNGMYRMGLGSLTDIIEIRTTSFNQNNNRGSQRFAIYGSAFEENPGWDISDSSRFVPIAEVRVEASDRFLMTRLRRSAGGLLGKYRWLIWVVLPVTPAAENTAFQELQVFRARP